jgi:hypothetical protein
MKISEVEGLDSEKAAADTLKQNADRLKQQATQAAARVKLKTAQQQVAKSVQTPQLK